MKLEIHVDIDIDPRGRVQLFETATSTNIGKPKALRTLVRDMIEAGDQRTADLKFLSKELKSLAKEVDVYLDESAEADTPPWK